MQGSCILGIDLLVRILGDVVRRLAETRILEYQALSSLTYNLA